MENIFCTNDLLPGWYRKAEEWEKQDLTPKMSGYYLIEQLNKNLNNKQMELFNDNKA